jgi:hypothetical protein
MRNGGERKKDGEETEGQRMYLRRMLESEGEHARSSKKF